MGVGAIRRGEGFRSLSRAAVTAAAFALWAFLALALELGEWYPAAAHFWRLGLLLGLPAGLLLVLLLRRTPASRELQLLTAGICLGAGALWTADLVGGSLVAALAVPGLLASALFARKWPATAILIAFGMTGTYGSLQAFTPLQPGQVVDAVLAGMWLGLAFVVFTKPRPRTPLASPGMVVGAAYVFITLLFVPFAESMDQGLRSFRTSAWYMVAFLVIAYAGWDATVLRRAAKGVVVIAAGVGAYATLRWAIGPSGKEKALLTDPVYNQVGSGQEKVQGSLPSGSELGFWTAVMIPFCVGAALGFRGRSRLVAIVAVPLLLLGLMGAQMRVGLAAAAIGTVVVLLVHQLSRGFKGLRLEVGVAALLAIVIAGVVIFPAVVNEPASRQRYSNLLHPSRDASFQERLFKWKSAFADIEHHPFGRGLASAGVRRDYQRFSTVGTLELDNSYVKVAYEQGTGVMIFFAVTLILLFLDLVWRGIGARSPDKAAVAAGACGTLASLMVVLVTGLFIELLPALAVWMVVGIALGLANTPDGETEGAAA
jgi:hypothetical protein